VFSRDVNRRPTANELLKHPFVEAYGAAAEANAATQHRLIEDVPTEITPSLEAASIEEAADQTLARQATGLLSKRPEYIHRQSFILMLGDSDGAKGFVFESFRMPSGKDATRDEQVLEVRTNLDPNNQLRHDEAVVTMFISKEAAAQFAGAERHFPDRPPTARPSGAPPRSAAFPPLRHNREQQSSDHQTGKSPLLMAHLPRRKQGNSCGLGPARKFGNTSLDSSLLRVLNLAAAHLSLHA